MAVLSTTRLCTALKDLPRSLKMFAPHWTAERWTFIFLTSTEFHVFFFVFVVSLLWSSYPDIVLFFFLLVVRQRTRGSYMRFCSFPVLTRAFQDFACNSSWSWDWWAISYSSWWKTLELWREVCCSWPCWKWPPRWFILFHFQTSRAIFMNQTPKY